MRAFIFATLIATSLLGGCVATSSRAIDLDPAQPVFEFPEDWAGRYEGQLNIWGHDEPVQSLGMSLEIAPIADSDRWAWQIQYEGQPPLDYELITVDADTGIYQIDEKNGIVLYAFRKGNDLISSFSGPAGYLTVHYNMEADWIDFSVTGFSEKPVDVTGGEKGMGEFSTYWIQSWQTAHLRRVEEF